MYLWSIYSYFNIRGAIGAQQRSQPRFGRGLHNCCSGHLFKWRRIMGHWQFACILFLLGRSADTYGVQWGILFCAQCHRLGLHTREANESKLCQLRHNCGPLHGHQSAAASDKPKSKQLLAVHRRGCRSCGADLCWRPGVRQAGWIPGLLRLADIPLCARLQLTDGQ